jgi:hypothetical protein
MFLIRLACTLVFLLMSSMVLEVQKVSTPAPPSKSLMVVRSRPTPTPQLRNNLMNTTKELRWLPLTIRRPICAMRIIHSILLNKDSKFSANIQGVGKRLVPLLLNMRRNRLHTHRRLHRNNSNSSSNQSHLQHSRVPPLKLPQTLRLQKQLARRRLIMLHFTMAETSHPRPNHRRSKLTLTINRLKHHPNFLPRPRTNLRNKFLNNPQNHKNNHYIPRRNNRQVIGHPNNKRQHHSRHGRLHLARHTMAILKSHFHPHLIMHRNLK